MCAMDVDCSHEGCQEKAHYVGGVSVGNAENGTMMEADSQRDMYVCPKEHTTWVQKR